MVRNIVPSVAWSGGVVEQIGSLFGKKAEEQEENAESRETYLRCFGVGEGLKDEAENAAIRYLFTEGTWVLSFSYQFPVVSFRRWKLMLL